MEDISSSPEAVAIAQKSIALEDEIGKFKGKVAMEEKDKDHSNLMLKYYKDDNLDTNGVDEFTSKVSNCMHRVGNL